MHIQPGSLSIPTNSVLVRKKKKNRKRILKHKCSHIQTHAHCCFQYSGWTHAHSTPHSSHLFPYHPSPSLHFYLSFSYPLSRILDFPPTIYPSKALPLFTHPSYFFGGAFQVEHQSAEISTPTHHTHMLLTSRFTIFVSHIFHPVSLFFSPYFFFF